MVNSRISESPSKDCSEDTLLSSTDFQIAVWKNTFLILQFNDRIILSNNNFK